MISLRKLSSPISIIMDHTKINRRKFIQDTFVLTAPTSFIKLGQFKSCGISRKKLP